LLKTFLILLGTCLGAVLAQADTHASQESPPDGSDSLTLEQALERILNTHPALEAGRSAVSARAAAGDQAGRGPNPEVGIEVEDALGTGSYRGLDAAQTTFQISQTLEWGGKRSRRQNVASAERKLAESDLRRKRLELKALTRVHFMEVLAAQQRLALAQEAVTLAQRLLEAVARRVKEGAASSADEIRARLAVTEANMEARQDTLRLIASKKGLALLLGDENLPLPPLRGDLGSLPDLDSPESLAQGLERSPEAALKADAVKAAEARLLQQKSLAGPDVTLNAGLRHVAAPNDLALVGGVSLPLPMRNRNQGGKEEARHELGRAKAEEKAFRLELKSAMAEIQKELALARNEAGTLRESLIPDAEKAAQVLEEGYRRGRFGVLDVLSAKGDLFRHRLRYLDAVLRYQKGYAELRRFMGAEDATERTPK
jgi:outer membrane protein, heavy metal efflux system